MGRPAIGMGRWDDGAHTRHHSGTFSLLPNRLLIVVVDLLEYVPVHHTAFTHFLGQRGTPEFRVGRHEWNRGGLRPNRFFHGRHAHLALIFGDVEDHVIDMFQPRNAARGCQ